MFSFKRLIPTVLLMLSSATTNAAEYNKGFFIKGEVGKIFAQKFKDTPDAGYIEGSVNNYALYGAGVGYKFNTQLSASLGIQYRRFKYNAMLDDERVSQKINNYFLTLSGHYNISTSTIFTPYLSAGIGYTYNNPSDLKGADDTEVGGNFTAPNQKTQAFVWNLGLGTRVKLNNSLDLDFSYRYMHLGKVKVGATATKFKDLLEAASQNLKGHQIMLGIIFNV